MSYLDDHPIILMGASAGGVSALLRLAPTLKPNFPAPILVVLHVGKHRNLLPFLISGRGPNLAVSGADGETPVPGRIYFAPSDQHMLLNKGTIRLNRDTKEHFTRPAIDPLFRSAAIDCGRRAIGVILTGTLNDGTAGLRAIKSCGGITIVQEPQEAQESSMPQSALDGVSIDHVAPLETLGALLHRLVTTPRPSNLVIRP